MTLKLRFIWWILGINSTQIITGNGFIISVSGFQRAITAEASPAADFHDRLIATAHAILNPNLYRVAVKEVKLSFYSKEIPLCTLDP